MWYLWVSLREDYGAALGLYWLHVHAGHTPIGAAQRAMRDYRRELMSTGRCDVDSETLPYCVGFDGVAVRRKPRRADILEQLAREIGFPSDGTVDPRHEERRLASVEDRSAICRSILGDELASALALGLTQAAAGLLVGEDERTVRRHVQECRAACMFV